MFQCMKCSEMVGDNVKTCPFCGHYFTPDEMKELRQAKEMEEYEKKHTKGAIFRQTKFWRILFVVLAALSAVLAIVAKFALESHVLMIFFFCAMIVFCVGIWVVIIKERI